MELLSNWKARRSGGRITITATDETGAEIKVPNVDTIEARRKQGLGKTEMLIVARDKDGDEYQLAAA